MAQEEKVVQRHTVASVVYTPGKDLPEALAKAKGIGVFDFAEVKVMNSIPSTEIDKVSSPSKRVKEVLANHNIKITLD